MRHSCSFIAAMFCASLSTGACSQPQSPTPQHFVYDRDAQISEYVREVYQDRGGDYWFGTNGDGVCRYDGESLTYLSVNEGLAGRAIRGIVQDVQGAMWFATDGGVSRYEGGKFTNYTVANGLSDNGVWSIMLDRSGTLWVGTHEGVCRFAGGAFVPFPLPRVEVEHPESRFSPRVVFAMFQDRAGNIWFGTDGEGVHKYDGTAFTSYTTKEGLAGNLVRAVAGDRRGRVWIGTDGGGASCLDGTGFRNFTMKDGLGSDRVYEILEDRAGNMWFSTLGAGACRYDGATFTQFPEDHSLMINGRPARSHIQEFFQDRDGVLWLGCSGGLFRMEGEKFINVTRSGPWPVSAKGKGAGPMAGFARMEAGEWRRTYGNGAKQVDTWHWGPGGHSILERATASGGPLKPWRTLRLFYWHPGRKQVRFLGISPFLRSVSEGSFEFKGEIAEAFFEISQEGGRREMSSRWTFDGPDKYHETLLEDAGTGYRTLVEWDSARSRALTPAEAMAPPAGEEEPRGSERLRALASLVGQTWEAGGHWGGADGEAFQVRSTFEWIPYADVVYARTVGVTKAGEGEPAHLFDTYFYHHTGTDSLRCVALSSVGGVYEGGMTVLDGGAVQLELTGYEGERVVPYVVRLDFDKESGVRERAWTVKGEERTLRLDVVHKKIEPGRD